MQDSYQPRNISQHKDDRQGLQLPSLQGLGTDLEQRIDRRQRRWLTELHTPGDSIPAHDIWSFPGGSDGKESVCNAGEPGSIPGSGRSPGKGMATHSPVFLPGEFHGQRSLVGYSPWGRYESDTTERLHFHFSLSCTGEGNGNPLVFLPGEFQGRGSLKIGRAHV